MPSSDLSDFSDSESDQSPPVSLDCATCKKKFKSTDRGCDKDERTCSTCTKKANKILMNAFLVEPSQRMPHEAASTPTMNSDLQDNVAVGGDASVNCDASVDVHKGKNIDDIEKTNDKDKDPASSQKCGNNIFSTPCISAQLTNDQGDELDNSDISDVERQSESSNSDQSEGEGTQPKSKGRRKRKMSVGNFDGNVDDLLIDEASIECMCGGRTRTLVRKTFKMDRGTTIKLFCDLELLDELPLLYSYYILSAHVNPTLKRSVRGMRVVEDQNGKKSVVLCVFRSKCPNPRYDIVNLDPAEPDQTKAVKRICGLTNFFKWYKYVPDEAFDNDYAIRMLKEFLMNKFDDKGRALVYDQTKGPNKDEMGRPMSEGYDPVNPVTIDKDGISPAAPKRVSIKRVDLFADEQGNDTPWVRKQARRSKRPNKKTKVPTKQKVVFAVDDSDGDEEHYDDEDDTTLGWEDPKPIVDEAAEWRRKYEELAAQQVTSSKKAAALPTIEPSVVAEKKEKEKKTEQKKELRKSVPEPTEEVRQGCGKKMKQGFTLRQVKAIQRQAVRMERYHQSEMDSAARDTLALAGGDDGDY